MCPSRLTVFFKTSRACRPSQPENEKTASVYRVSTLSFRGRRVRKDKNWKESVFFKKQWLVAGTRGQNDAQSGRIKSHECKELYGPTQIHQEEKACVNPQNFDDVECSNWSILAHDVPDDPHIIDNSRPFEKEYDYKDNKREVIHHALLTHHYLYPPLSIKATTLLLPPNLLHPTSLLSFTNPIPLCYYTPHPTQIPLLIAPS